MVEPRPYQHARTRRHSTPRGAAPKAAAEGQPDETEGEKSQCMMEHPEDFIHDDGTVYGGAARDVEPRPHGRQDDLAETTMELESDEEEQHYVLQANTDPANRVGNCDVNVRAGWRMQPCLETNLKEAIFVFRLPTRELAVWIRNGFQMESLMFDMPCRALTCAQPVKAEGETCTTPITRETMVVTRRNFFTVDFDLIVVSIICTFRDAEPLLAWKSFACIGGMV